MSIHKIVTLFLLYLGLFLSSFTLAQEQTVGVLNFEEGASDAYTMFVPLYSFNTYLIDNCGKVAHIWPGDSRPGMMTYLNDDGSIYRAQKSTEVLFGTTGGFGGEILHIDWDGTLLWKMEYNTPFHQQHHDIEIMPNGNILFIAWEYVSAFELDGLGRDPSITSTQGLWMDHIMEITPIGTNDYEVVWEWHMKDHLIQDFDPEKENYGVIADNPGKFDINYQWGPTTFNPDWAHTNGIDYNEELDQIAISSLYFNEFFIIDHSTTSEEAASDSGGNTGKGGEILYRWGSPSNYDRGEELDRKIAFMHDIQWIPEGYPHEGKLIYFHNGRERVNGFSYSTVEILEPPLLEDGTYALEEGEAYGPEELSWVYPEEPDFDFFSAFLSSAHIQPNGNVLMCEGSRGRISEVDTSGNKLWEFVNPVTIMGTMEQGEELYWLNEIFKAQRIPTDHPAFDHFMPDQDGPSIELDPWPSDCTVLSTSIEEAKENERELFSFGLSNTNNTESIIFYNHTEAALAVKVLDVNGKLIYNELTLPGSNIIHCSKWANGVYFFQSKNNQQHQSSTWVKTSN